MYLKGGISHSIDRLALGVVKLGYVLGAELQVLLD